MSSPFFCVPVRLVQVLVGPGSVTLSAFHVESWAAVENDHSVDGKLSKWECDLLPPPVMGQILPALLCGSGALPLHISKVCGHSVMTLFPTVLIMDITFDKCFIN